VNQADARGVVSYLPLQAPPRRHATRSRALRSEVSFCFKVFVDCLRLGLGIQADTVLLHRDTFGQIARFIDIAATPTRYVISEQLERHDSQERLHNLGRLGNRQEYIR
jgi:hypothetical protein